MRELADRLFDSIVADDRRLSIYVAESLINRINQAAGKEPVEAKAKAATRPRALNKAQKVALEALQFAQTLDEVMAAVAALKPEERSDKRVGFPVYQATERIVNRAIPLL